MHLHFRMSFGLRAAVLLWYSCLQIGAFLPVSHFRPNQPRELYRQNSGIEMLSDSSSIHTAVIEYFDGSSVVDSAVVSQTFWNGLQSRIISFALGNLFAVVAFSIFTSVAAPSIMKAGDWVSLVFSANKEPKLQVRPVSERPRERKYYNLPPPDFSRLLICVAIDIIGSSNELVPVVGEVVDVIWAPLAATLLRSLFGGSNVILILEFAEEILPFTDILPLATICWVVDTFLVDSELAKLLQLGIYRSDAKFAVDDDQVIDVPSGSSRDPRGNERR